MELFEFVLFIPIHIKKGFKFSFIIAGILFFSSCKKDDTIPSSLNRSRVTVKEVIYFDDLSVAFDTMKYSYTSTNLISEISNCRLNSSFTVSFDYENSTITYNPYNETQTETFRLNKNGTLAQYTLFENSFELEYDEEGFLIGAKGHDRETSPREFNYEYENENLVKITGHLGSAYYTFIEYSTIPNKSNFTNIEQDELLSGSYFIGMTGRLNKNLIKRVIHENFDTLNYEYEFNADSLVTKVIINGMASCIIKYYN
jgi:hypothetical protein